MTNEPERTESSEGREPPARPLDYVRPSTRAAERRPLPVIAGLAVGFAVFFGTVTAWWPIGRMSESAFFLGLAVVPSIALVVGLILRSTFGWRGVVAGVLIALGLTILIPGIALLVICGGMRLK
jgi:hypothetical protein